MELSVCVIKDNLSFIENRFNKWMIVLSLVFSSISISLAQDTHYWSQQFGARSALLGGAAIAGLDDNSAVFYNPANLAFIKQTTVSINTSVYKYEDLTIQNGAGDGIDMKSQRISLFQNMLSGLITKNPEKKYRVGFNILTRAHANYDFNSRNEGFYDIVDQYPGMEYYIGGIELRNNLSETWGCIGTGYRFNEHISVGLTAVVSYRSQRHTLSYFGRALSAPDTMSSSTNPIATSSNQYYFHMRSNVIGGLLKAGFHARYGPWRFGLNITSPSLTFWGASRVERELTQNNLPNNTDIVKTDEQRNLRSRYIHPLSIGFGVAYHYKKGLISLSGEYFFSVEQYEMIEADSTDPTFPSYLSNGVEKFLTVFNGADAVLNMAIGWEHQINNKMIVHLGMRSDFSYARNSNRVIGLTIATAPYDIYHISSGLSFRRKASRISLGLNYSIALRKIGQIINLTNPTINGNQNLFLFGKTEPNASIIYHSVTLLIGYTYYFALK